jgi:hypothetical protein
MVKFSHRHSSPKHAQLHQSMRQPLVDLANTLQVRSSTGQNCSHQMVLLPRCVFTKVLSSYFVRPYIQHWLHDRNGLPWMLRPDPLLCKKYAKRKKHSHQLTRTRSMDNSWGRTGTLWDITQFPKRSSILIRVTGGETEAEHPPYGAAPSTPV